MSNMEGMIRNLPFKRRITPPHEKIVHEKIVFEVPYADHHFQMHGASVLVECDIGADLSSHPAHPLPTFELRTSLPRKCINEGLRFGGADVRDGSKMRNTPREYMFSALPLNPDMLDAAGVCFWANRRHTTVG
jgi:hypothetical protein